MSGRIRLSAEELEQLSSKTNQRKQDVDEVIKDGTTAVTSRIWQSSSATSFENLWNRDKDLLKRLSDDLQSWSNHCKSQAPIARRVNEPFRT
ncbi:MAG TPA: hypothetical protein VGE45_20695 [Chloroflexia bacterium]|jgi:uncharacterized protein YukE